MNCATIQKKESKNVNNRDIEDYEINKITQLCPIREQAFFTIMRQSGLTPKTIKKIRIKDVERILERYTPAPCKIDIPQEKGKLGKAPVFIGEEAIKYIKRYLLTRTNRTTESLLFTVRNNPNKEINTKDVSRTFRSKAQKCEKTKNITHKVMNGKPNELRLYSLVKFYRKNAKDYLTELNKYSSIKDDEFYRTLYEEKAMRSLEIEPPPTRDIQQLRQRLEKIESTIFPKYRPGTGWMAEARRIEEWIEKNPEEARLQQERQEDWEREREEEFKAYQRIMKENPDGLIAYLQDLKEKIEVIKIILQKQLKTQH
jgi:hypothetical protein